MSHPQSSAPAAQTRLTPAARLVITLLLISAFIVILNETIMSIAIPVITSDFEIEVATGQWLSTAFMLTMAVVIPITGYLLQRLHTRTLFLAAMTLFSSGTLIAALAPTFGLLVTGRVVQASGTAIMMPLLMTTVMTLVPPAARGRTMGNIAIVMSVAPAVGPALSGFILRSLPWPFLFWLVLPIAVSMLILGAIKVPNISEPRALPLDVPSVLLAAAGFGGLVFGLSAIGESAHGDPAVAPAAPIAVGALMLAAFIWRQLRLQRHDRALLDLRTFKAPTFATSVAMMALMMLTLFGIIILLPVYLQRVLGLEPAAAGALMLPGGLVMGLLGPFVGRLYDRFGPRVLLVPGAIVVSGSLWLMSTLHEQSSSATVLVMHIVLSIGLALMFTPLFTTALGSLPVRLYSHGSAIIGTLQQLAAACGTAMFVMIYTLRSITALDEGSPAVVAEAQGVRTALIVGAVLSLLVIVGAFFVRKPTEPEEIAAVADPDDVGRAPRQSRVSPAVPR